jgi:threonine synthase|tara:strand:- start:5995 stop:7407 length:1413 start_codon:yes stop_codon:yes gene_type:complete
MTDSIKYTSTRGGEQNLSFDDVLLTGLARDGGLYMPESWPSFSYKKLLEMKHLDYPTLASEIIKQFVGKNLEKKIDFISKSVYSTFDNREIAPIVKLKENIYLMELFHGPTLAFKDYAMMYLSELFDEVLKEKKKKVVILGATSGDTGSAALEAFKLKKNIDIFIFFPHNRVSNVQKKQMTTIYGPGTESIALKSDFDGCQNLVKSMFNDIEFRDEISLSAINSINWARLIPQIVYYFYGAFKVGAPEKEVIFSVPTGNFGNILAGWIALKMGLPIRKLICGSNRNDVLTRLFNNGYMKKSSVVPSLSPSMDIQVSSNFERFLFELLDRDVDKLNFLMNNFEKNDYYQLENHHLKKALKYFDSFSVSDAEILQTIKYIYKENKYIIDPHTAVGIRSIFLSKNKKDIEDLPIVSLACAHPSKFPNTIFKSLSFYPEIPKRLSKILNKKENFKIIDYNLAEVKNYIIKKMKK